ncbi:MAG: transcription elongation factor GreA [bacterium]
MQIPKRKGEEDRRLLKKTDNFLTVGKIKRLKVDLERLKQQIPTAAEEVRRTAEMGDLSENAAYQIAKHTLRKIHSRILVIEDQLRNAIPIDESASADGKVRIGSTVKLKLNNSEIEYQIVGERETNPSQGRISHTSPLGSALLGHTVGDAVTIEAGDRKVEYTILQVK